jgi:hypothetical protein
MNRSTTPDCDAADVCSACGAKEGEPCRGNCERRMPSHVLRSELSNERLCQWADKHDIDGTVIDIRAAVTDALDTFTRSATGITTHEAIDLLVTAFVQNHYPSKAAHLLEQKGFVQDEPLWHFLQSDATESTVRQK